MSAHRLVSRVTIALSFLLLPAIAARAQQPPSGTFVPCSELTTAPAYKGHQVTMFSEGTAWQNEKWVWLTVFNPTTSTQPVWIRVYVDGQDDEINWAVDVEPRRRAAWNMNDEIFNRLGLRGRINFATVVDFSTLGVANIAVWSWDYQAVPVYLLGTNHCQTWTGRPFTNSGTGDQVFDIPEDVTRIRVQGTFAGSSQNFIVRVNNSPIVNVILGTSQFASGTTYDGTLLTNGGTVVSITSSNGVQWTITEAP